LKQKALLIAEKPSLERKIKEVYEKHKNEFDFEIDFLALRGHILALKMPEELDESLKTWSFDNLPIFPEEHGGWQYKIPAEKKEGNYMTSAEKYKALGDALKSNNYDFIINAGDPDQEGELLVRIPLMALRNRLPVKRFWTNAQTEPDVVNALKNLRDDDHDPMLTNLLAAAYARQHSDYRVGINASRAAKLKMGGDGPIGVGRCETVMQAIICRRELDIKNFKPKTVYGVKASYDVGFSGQLFEPKTEGNTDADDEDDKKDDIHTGLIWFDTVEEAEECINDLGNNAIVESVQKTRKKTLAGKLFRMSDLQEKASQYGYDSESVMKIAQSLYEAGYMSYPRTSCEYISSNEDLDAMIKSASSVPTLVPFIKTITRENIEKARRTPKWINDEKIKDEGHTALVPTTQKPSFESLSHDQQIIYRMVCQQFIAIFLPPLLQDKTVVVTDIDGKKFRSNGTTLVDKGYTAVFGSEYSDVELPAVSEGENLTVERFEKAEKTSTCPKYMTDGELIKFCTAPAKYLDDPSLKKLGKRLKIGTDATRAGIITKLIEHSKYVYRERKGQTPYLRSTEKGMIVYENLKDLPICKVDVTGQWEMALEDIRQGKLTVKEFEVSICEDVRKLVDAIKNAEMKQLAGSGVSTAVLCQCPKCGGNIISGKKGFYCSEYKQGCKVGAYRTICDTMLNDSDIIKLVSGEKIYKTIKKGDKSWVSKLAYNYAEQKIEFAEETDFGESEYVCPNCSRKLIKEGLKYKCECGFQFLLFVGKEKKLLTEKEVSNFFSRGSTGTIKGVVGSKGKFDAALVLSEDKMGSTFKFAFKAFKSKKGSK
jgi:DNA topoisomerase-3